MTRKRYDQSSTEFGLWLREQKEICSYLGYRASNLDYIWAHESGAWCMIEEKRHMAALRPWQEGLFRRMHDAAKFEEKYRGFYFINFENTSPEDGRIYWTKLFCPPFEAQELTKDELLVKLRSVLA